MENQNHLSSPAKSHTLLYEYLLFISPSEKVKGEMMKMKEDFHSRHNHIQAIKSKPHITLINFGASIATEEILIIRIDDVIKFHKPFEVTLNGVNHFKTHTIFIDVANPKPIVQLVKSLHGSLHLPSQNSFFAWRPHMTLAKGLDQNKFQDAITELADTNYADSFPVDKIILMRRSSRFMKYELVKEFKLGMK
jgi:2'-5' RNA ligase